MANEVKLKLAIEGGQVVSATVDGVTTRLEHLGTQVKATSSASDSLKTALGALATVGTALAIVKMADSVTTLRTALALSANSAADAGKAYNALFDIAQRGRVSFTELGTTYAAIARAGNEMGVSQSRLLTVTQSISQAMTIGGGSAASMQAALVQLGQGLGSGTLRGEELNSIMEQTPRLAKAIADGLGVPIGKLRELGMAGQLTGEQVIGALERSAPQLAKEMESATLTVGQAYAMLTNSAVKFAGDADNATGVTHGLASAMQNLSGGIDTVGNAIKNNPLMSSVIGGAAIGVAAVAGFATVASGIKSIAASVGLLNISLAANPYVLAVIGITAIAGGAIALSNAYDKTENGIKRMIDGLEQLNADALNLKTTLAKDPGNIILSGQLSDLDASAAKRVETLKTLRDELQKMQGDKIIGSAQSPDRLLARIDSEAQAKANADLGALKQKLSGVPQEYIDTMKKIGELHASGALVGKDYTDMLEKAHGLLKKSPATVSEAAKGITLYDDLMAQSAKANANYTEQQNKLTAAYLVGEKGKKLSLDEYSAAMAVLVAQQPYMLANVKAQTAADAAAAKADIDGFKAMDDARKANESEMQKTIKTIGAQEMATQTASEAIAFESSLLGLNTEQRKLAIEQYKIEAEWKAKVNAINQQGDLTKDQKDVAIARLSQDKIKQLHNASAKSVGDTWAATATTIRDSLTDAFMGAIDNGKSLFVNLRDSVIGMFKTLVLRPYIQATIGGAMGMGTGAAMADSGGASSLGTAANLAGLYDKVSGGFAGLGNAAGDAAYRLGMNMSSTAGDLGSTLITNADKIGAGVSALSTALAGVTLGSLIGGNKVVMGMDSTATSAIGAGIGYALTPVLGPLGPLLGGALGGVFSGIFGSGPTQMVGQGTRGTFSGNSFTGSNYTNYYQEGGWFSGDSRWTVNSSMDASTANAWSYAFGTVKSSVADMAKGLGLSTAQITNYSKTIDWAAGTTAEQITAAFGAMADDMARAAAPAINAFGHMGETASTTLARLSNSLSEANKWLGMFNQTLLTPTLSSGDTASKLMDKFGGLGQYSSAQSAYYGAMYTQEQQTAKTAENVAKGLDLVNVQMPTSLDAFNQFRNALDVTSEAGRNTYTVMTLLGPEFASVTKAATEYLNTLKATASADYKAARDKIDQTKAFSQSVKDLMLTLATSGNAAAGMTAAQARTRFTETNSLALNGDTAARSNLSDAATKYLEIAKASSQTSAQYAAAYAYVQSALATTALVTDAAVTVADQQLTALTTIASYLKEIDAKSATQNLTLGTLVSNAVASTAATLNMTAASAASVISANAPVIDNTKVTGDVLLDMNKNKGTSATTVSSGGGGNILTNLVSGAAGAVGSVVSGVTGAVGSVLGAIGGIFSDPRLKENISFSGQTSHGLNLYDYNYIGKPASERWRGVMSPEVRALYPDAVSNFGGYDRVNYAKLGLDLTKSPPGFALGGMHAGGLRIVGENGPELEATGPSRIWNAADTSQMLHGGARANNARLEALVEALTLEVKALKTSAKDTADNTRTTAKTLVNVTRGGDSMQCTSSSTATLIGV